MKSASICTASSTISLMLLVSLSVAAQTAPEKWEYKIVNTCNPSEESNLNKLGDQGWELVSVQWNDNSSCFNYYLKRPKGFFATQPPAQTTGAPNCALTLAQAPVIRGIRLGMSTEELLVLFPGSKDQFRIKEALARAEVQYGATDLLFSSTEYPENKLLFNNISRHLITLFDGHVVKIAVSYIFGPDITSPGWTIETWIDKVSEIFNLPKRESWESSRRITCRGFTIEAFVNHGSETSITIINLSYRQQIDQRKKAEYEKRQREFKP